MKKIAIIGAGGFGREVLTLIEAINILENQYRIIGFYDDDETFSHQEINGYPFLGKVSSLNEIKEEIAVAVAIGNPVTKRNIIYSLTNPLITFPTLIHPSVIIGSPAHVVIGKGCIITAYNVLTTNIEVKDFVILNLFCTTGHDTVIESFASFMPSVNISGEVLIGEAVYVGTGAKIINQLEIGKNTIIGAGAVVSKSLPENCTAVGIPAKPIKFHS